MVSLIALTSLVIAWLLRHFTSLNVVLIAVGSAVPIAVTVGSVVLGEERLKRVRKYVDPAFVRLLSPIVLACLWMGWIVLATFVTTVRVVADPEAANTPVTFTFLGRRTVSILDSLDAEGGVWFVARTAPAGRRVAVTASGYTSDTFPVPPFLGLSIRLSQLPEERSVLLRPGPEGLAALNSRGSLRAYLVTPSESVLVAETTGVTASAFLLGGQRAPVTTTPEAWTLELARCSEATRNRMLQAWRAWTPLPSEPVRIATGGRLHAAIRARDSTLVAEAHVELGPDARGDIAVPDVGARNGGCP
jgi:hypothetical protein